MYEVGVEHSFRAAHAITMGGEVEERHDHDWRVRVVVAGERVDGEGLLCDFHLLQRGLEAVVTPWAGRDLNQIAPFDRTNPTAEHLARHIAERMGPTLPAGVTLRSVSVTEAPGCVATYRPGPPVTGPL